MRILKILAVVSVAGVCALMVYAYRHAETAKKPHSVNLHWQPSPGAASYNIYRRTEDGTFQKIGSSKTATYVDTPVPSGAVFYYGVTTVEGNQESKISNIIRVEIPKD
jgi:fibronectin type 3 domain-containing protein